MSIVSSASDPSMVMVFSRRLVFEKSPMIVEGVTGPGAASRSRRIDSVDADFLDLGQLGDDIGEASPTACDDDLRRAAIEAA